MNFIATNQNHSAFLLFDPEYTPSQKLVFNPTSVGFYKIDILITSGLLCCIKMLEYNLFQRWKVFLEVPEIIVLVPALLGLKGNLEMTLASRLSTEANLGNMEDSKEQWSMITANLILVQVSLIITMLYLMCMQFS